MSAAAMPRAAFPSTPFLVRLDGGFATPEILNFLDAEPRLDYVVATAKNAVLQRHADSTMAVARAQTDASGRTEHVYTDTRYAAGTSRRERRVVIKAEVVRLKGHEPRGNPRSGRDESLEQLALCLRAGLLRPRGHREPESRSCWTACRSIARAAASSGEPVARVVDRGGLRPYAGAAAAGSAHRRRPHPGDVASRPTVEAGGRMSSARRTASSCICHRRRPIFTRGGISHWRSAPRAPFSQSPRGTRRTSRSPGGTACPGAEPSLHLPPRNRPAP